MSDERLKAVKITTPRGIAVRPKLADPYNEFNDAGTYTCMIRISGATAKALAATIDAVDEDAYQSSKAKIAAAKATEKNPAKRAEIKDRADPSYREVFNDANERTGEFDFTFKMMASGVSKKDGKPWTRKPAVFDGKRKLMPNDLVATVGSGSVIKVSGEVAAYAWKPGLFGAGAALRLDAVQVISLKSYANVPASDHGFRVEDDGFDGAAACPT